MSELYYQKYLKYKQKYLELQKLQKLQILQQKIQSGGDWNIHNITDLLKTPRNFDIFEGDEQNKLTEYFKNKDSVNREKLHTKIIDRFREKYDTKQKRENIKKEIEDKLSKQKERRDEREKAREIMRSKYLENQPEPKLEKSQFTDSGSASVHVSPLSARKQADEAESPPPASARKRYIPPKPQKSLTIVEPPVLPIQLPDDTDRPPAISVVPRSSQLPKQSSLPHELLRESSVSNAQRIINEIGRQAEEEIKKIRTNRLDTDIRNKYPFINDITDLNTEYSYVLNKMILIKIKENTEFDKIDKDYYIELYELFSQLDLLTIHQLEPNISEEKMNEDMERMRILNSQIQSIQLTYQIERQKETQRKLLKEIEDKKYTLRQKEGTVLEQDKLINEIRDLTQKKHGRDILGTESKHTLKKIIEIINGDSDESPLTPDETSEHNIANVESQLERALSVNEEQTKEISKELGTVTDEHAKKEIEKQMERLKLYDNIIKTNIEQQKTKFKAIVNKTSEIKGKHARKLNRMNDALKIIQGQLQQLEKFTRLLNKNDTEYLEKIERIQEECNLRNYDNFDYIYANEKIKKAITRVPVKDDIISGIDKIMEDLGKDKKDEQVQQQLGRMLSIPNAE